MQDESIPLQKVLAFAAGQRREFSLQIAQPVYWRKSGAKLLYRDPAFLIRADRTLAIETLLQAYMDRWQIACNHRDEKSFPGVAQGQVRNPLAVARPPQFLVVGLFDRLRIPAHRRIPALAQMAR